MDTIENEPANGECGEGCEVEEAVTVVSSVRIVKLRRDIFVTNNLTWVAKLE